MKIKQTDWEFPEYPKAEYKGRDRNVKNLVLDYYFQSYNDKIPKNNNLGIYQDRTKE